MIFEFIPCDIHRKYKQLLEVVVAAELVLDPFTYTKKGNDNEYI